MAGGFVNGGDELTGGLAARRRQHARGRWFGVAVVLAIATVILLFVLREGQVIERRNDNKSVQVVLPPPPPPPPPPEPKLEPKPLEPKPTPVEQPTEPVPEEPAPDAPVQDALTAREGAGPSNYGLAQGDGSGVRIGGKPGNAGFAAYVSTVQDDMRQVLQRDKKLAKGRYSIQLLVAVDRSGRITRLDLIKGSGDSERDRAILALLENYQLASPPPAGLPAVRIEFNAQPGA